MPDPADLCADFRCGHRLDEHDAFSGRCGATVPVDRVSRAYTFCDCTEFTETSPEGAPDGDGECVKAGSGDAPAPGPALTETTSAPVAGAGDDDEPDLDPPVTDRAPAPAQPSTLGALIDDAVWAASGNPADERWPGDVAIDTITDPANRDLVIADLTLAGFLVPAGHAYRLDNGTVVHPDSLTGWSAGTRIQLYRLGGA